MHLPAPVYVGLELECRGILHRALYQLDDIPSPSSAHRLPHAADGFCFGHRGSVQWSSATHSFKLWISASDVAGIVQGERTGCCLLWSLPHLTGPILTARGVRPCLDFGPSPHASVPISLLSRCHLHRIKHPGGSYTCFDKHTHL